MADLAAMLLSNMTKVENVSGQLLALRIPFPRAAPAASEGSDAPAPAEVEEPQEDVEALDLLLEVFLKGEGKKYNPNANYDFLASVFANVSTVRRPSARVLNPRLSRLLRQITPGRHYLLATSSAEQEPPLAKLISFTEHPATIRRGGVASSIKCGSPPFVKDH